MHYADDPDYAGDWWLQYGFDDPYEVHDGAMAVERAREAGEFRTQADYDAAYARALRLRSPDELHERLAEQVGLRALVPRAIGAERLIELQELCPRHTASLHAESLSAPELALHPAYREPVPESALITLRLQQDRSARPIRRWTSGHPVVLALLDGSIDGAVTMPTLSLGHVHLALTERTRTGLRTRPELLHGLVLDWALLRALTPRGSTVQAVYAEHAWSFWDTQGSWSKPARRTLSTVFDGPGGPALVLTAQAALQAELRRTERALSELELLLEATNGLRPPRGDGPDDYLLG